MELNWVKSSYSATDVKHVNCVEVATTRDNWVAMQDSKHPDPLKRLFFTRDEFDAFVKGVKAGEFDRFC